MSIAVQEFRQLNLNREGFRSIDVLDDLGREEVMNEKRHWVRIAKACNNKCIFCHDADLHVGTMVDVEECKEEFRRGKEKGCSRLIISGGEASIHPHFIELIHYGKHVLGYKKVQTITNGRLFAKPEFAKACLEAGLDEVTFSIHAHIPSLSDKLSGAKDYHIHAVKGLLNMLRSRRVIVNMDIVLNKLNIRHLPEIFTYFVRLGVREFDLLYLVPFGRVMHDPTENLFFDPKELQPFLFKTLNLAKKWGVVVWTNRLPPPVLEGFENYIQDPHKIVSEMKGRYPEFRSAMDTLSPPSCYGDSCPECYVRDMCGLMQDDNRRLVKEDFEFLEAHAVPANFKPEVVKARREVMKKGKNLLIHAKSAREANRFAEWAEVLPPALLLRLESLEGFEELAPALLARLKKVTLRKAEALAEVLCNDVPFDLEVELNQETIFWLHAHLPLLRRTGRNLRFIWENTLLLKESLDTHASLHELTGIILEADIPTLNVAPCLSGGKPFQMPDDFFDIALVQADGKIDILGYANHYITHDYYSKSLRCRECIHDSSCPGVHINIVRNFGFQALHPLRPKTPMATF